MTAEQQSSLNDLINFMVADTRSEEDYVKMTHLAFSLFEDKLLGKEFSKVLPSILANDQRLHEWTSMFLNPLEFDLNSSQVTKYHQYFYNEGFIIDDLPFFIRHNIDPNKLTKVPEYPECIGFKAIDASVNRTELIGRNLENAFDLALLLMTTDASFDECLDAFNDAFNDASKKGTYKYHDLVHASVICGFHVKYKGLPELLGAIGLVTTDKSPHGAFFYGLVNAARRDVSSYFINESVRLAVKRYFKDGEFNKRPPSGTDREKIVMNACTAISTNKRKAETDDFVDASKKRRV